MKPTNRMVIGYATGVFDLFHVGHLNLLRNAKALCDKLIVGVTTNELLLAEKEKHAVIDWPERCEILRHIDCVDVVIPQTSMDKLEAWRKLKFDVLFVGDDWYETPRWEQTEGQLNEVGVQIVYFPYTRGTSSTLINEILNERRTKLGMK